MAGDEATLTQLNVRDAARKNYVAVTDTEPCSKVLSLFADGEPAVAVTDDKGRLRGVLSERHILRSNVEADPTQVTVAQVMDQNLPNLEPETRSVDAAARFLDTRARALALLDGDAKDFEIVVVEDLLKQAADAGFGKQPVRDYMTPDIVTAHEDDTVAKALSAMRRNGCSHLPVVSKGRLVGIVTLHDILRDVIGPMERHTRAGWKAGDRKSPLAIPVGGIMVTDVQTAPLTAAYGEVVERLRDKRIGSIVLTQDMDGGEFPRGIVTRKDLLDPLALLASDVPTIVVHFSSKDTSKDGYESSGAPAEVRSFLERYQTQVEPGILHIHAKKHKDRQHRTDLWHIRMNLTCDLGRFNAVGEGWGMQNATRLTVERLEREVRRAKEERQEYPSREFLEDILY